MSCGLVSTPAADARAAACAASDNRLLKTAKTCVSKGCSAHVILEGTNK